MKGNGDRYLLNTLCKPSKKQEVIDCSVQPEINSRNQMWMEE